MEFGLVAVRMLVRLACSSCSSARKVREPVRAGHQGVAGGASAVRMSLMVSRTIRLSGWA